MLNKKLIFLSFILIAGVASVQAGDSPRSASQKSPDLSAVRSSDLSKSPLAGSENPKHEETVAEKIDKKSLSVSGFFTTRNVLITAGVTGVVAAGYVWAKRKK